MILLAEVAVREAAARQAAHSSIVRLVTGLLAGIRWQAVLPAAIFSTAMPGNTHSVPRARRAAFLSAVSRETIPLATVAPPPEADSIFAMAAGPIALQSLGPQTSSYASEMAPPTHDSTGVSRTKLPLTALRKYCKSPSSSFRKQSLPDHTTLIYMFGKWLQQSAFKCQVSSLAWHSPSAIELEDGEIKSRNRIYSRGLEQSRYATIDEIT